MEQRVITASEGKVFRRKSDGLIFGNEIVLGYTYYINGEKLSEPLLELPEHFEEIDEPKEEEVIVDEPTDTQGDSQTNTRTI